MAKARAWSPAEIKILHTVYVKEGLLAAMKAMPGRSDGSIFQKAHKLGLHTEAQGYPQGSYKDFSEQAWLLRHEEKLSYTSIGEVLGCCEANATNAVLYAECIKAGHRPIERMPGGKLAPAGRDRLRLMFRKGWTHREIQERTGTPAATLTRERKLYAAYLKANGLAPLPPIGGGLRYSGARIPRAEARKVEQLYLEGYGTKTITRMTSVSNTHCLRTRDRLIKRLKRKGQCLPGCDEKGVRRIFKGHAAHVPTALFNELTRLVLAGETVARAADLVGIGRPTAYQHYEAIKAEAAKRGEPLPQPQWRSLRARPKIRAFHGKPEFIIYYRHYRETGSIADARELAFAEIDQAKRDALLAIQAERVRLQEERRRPKSIEEQIRLIEQGRATLYTERPMLPVELTFSPCGSAAAL